MDAGVLLRALELASRKHRDQRRKDKVQSPYINHPIAVSNMLWACGVRDEVALVAGILHDTIEDTQTTRDELAGLFGDAIADVVAEFSADR